jgi:hypothetical protein
MKIFFWAKDGFPGLSVAFSCIDTGEIIPLHHSWHTTVSDFPLYFSPL